MEEQLRRRAVGATAARSLLLTILGEYVLPRKADVWQETLVLALEANHYKTQAARQALGRSVSGGWLITERHGRRSRVSLTPRAQNMLEVGAQRIYSFGEPWEWDGHWLLVVVRVPEEQRELRHKARTRLEWAGFGSLGGGLWISPHISREAEIGGADELNGGPPEVLSFRAELGSVGEPRRVIDSTWNLDAIAAQYAEFISSYRKVRPKGLQATFRAQTMLVHEWRKFPFLDPDLPEEFLPRKWPARTAYELFHERQFEWNTDAQEFFGNLEASR